MVRAQPAAKRTARAAAAAAAAVYVWWAKATVLTAGPAGAVAEAAARADGGVSEDGRWLRSGPQLGCTESARRARRRQRALGRCCMVTADCAPPTGTALGGTKADAAARQVARSSERIIERPRLF